MLKQTLVFCAILGVAYSATAIARLEPKPDKFKNAEGCYISELDTVIPFGNSTPAKSSCMEYVCSTKFVNHISCGAVADAKPPCKKIEEDKPYPECCPKIVC